MTLPKNYIFKNKNFPDTKIIFPVDWHQNPYNNTDWQWSLHCMPFITQLVAMYEKTGNAINLDTARILMESWLDEFLASNYDDFPKYVWHDHSTALRVIVFCEFLEYKDTDWGRNEGQFWNKLYTGIEKHARFLVDEKNYSRNTNHGMDQAYALLKISAVLNNDENIKDLALARLINEFNFAFTEEGVHKENSPNYHTHVLHSFSKIFSGMPDDFKDVKDRFAIVANKSLGYLADVLAPDGFYPPIGDSEVLQPSNISDEFLCSLPAYPDFAWAVSCGKNGKKPEKLQKIYPKSGYAFYRAMTGSKWQEHYKVLIKAGSLSRYHYHCDEGNFLINAFGEEWIIDSGYYNYEENTPIRRYMRSRMGHNVPVLVGYSYGVERNHPLESWKINNYSDNENNPFIEFENNCYINACIWQKFELNAAKLELVNTNKISLQDPVKGDIHFLFHVPKDKIIKRIGDIILLQTENKCLSLRIISKEPWEFYVSSGINKNGTPLSLISKIRYTYDASNCIHIVFKPHTFLENSFTFNFQ